VTANDTRDVDNGANNLQNFPVLTSASNSGGNTTVVQGTFNSERTKSYRIDFYATATCNASGYGEGQTPIGSTTVTTDSNGNATFAATLPVAVPAGHVITATATDPQNNTSEFSLCQTVTGNSISADLSIAQTFPASGQV